MNRIEIFHLIAAIIGLFVNAISIIGYIQKVHTIENLTNDIFWGIDLYTIQYWGLIYCWLAIAWFFSRVFYTKKKSAGKLKDSPFIRIIFKCILGVGLLLFPIGNQLYPEEADLAWLARCIGIIPFIFYTILFLMPFVHKDMDFIWEEHRDFWKLITGRL